MAQRSLEVKLTAVIFALLLACRTCNAEGEEPSPEELLQWYEKALAPYERVAYKVDLTSRYYGSVLPQGTLVTEKTIPFWKDGERIKYILSSTVRFPNKGKISTDRQLNEWVFPEKGLITVIQDPEKKALRP